ncbi:MAG: hypothetical protein SGI72_15030 [Planctomycetota bacterium]|nr:hypothetical protein [Planctomycetota bacterium]
MKTFVAVCALVVLVSGGMAFSQGQGQGPGQVDLEKRVAALELELGTWKQKSDSATADLEETKTLLAKTLSYLEAQSRSASSMAATLDEAERLGFTFGINPDSRMTLLRGWREQLTVAQQAVPSVPAAKVDAPKPGGKNAKK